MKGIYILGEVRGAYRVQAFINFLIEHGYSNFYINSYRSKSNIVKLLNYFCDIIKLLQVDWVYVCPCQQQNQLLKIAFFLRKKVITEFYISQYDTNVLDRKIVNTKSYQAKKMYYNDRNVIQKSKYVLFLNNSEKNYYCNILNINQFDKRFISVPLVTFEKSAAHLNYYKGNKSKITICWCGTFIPLQGLDTIIRSIALLVKKTNKVEFIIWGDSDKKANEYIELVNKLNISSYIRFIFDWNNIKNWEKFIVDNCDLTLGIFGTSDKAKTVLANKVLDGVAYRTPVLTGFSSGAQEFFNGENDIFFTESSPDKIAQAIYNIMNCDYKYIMDRVENAYTVYKDNFSKTAYNLKMEKLFSDGILYD